MLGNALRARSNFTLDIAKLYISIMKENVFRINSIMVQTLMFMFM